MQLAQTAGATVVALSDEWHGRLMALLASDPGTAPHLERVVHEARELRPSGGQSLIGSVYISAHTTGNSPAHQAGHDRHITER